MKIAFVSTRGIPNNYGGFEQFAEYISVGLAERGHDVTVYCPQFHPYKENEYKGVHLKHIYSPELWMGSSVGSFFYDFLSLRDALKKDKFDIVYEAGYTSIIPAYIWYNVKRLKSPIITTNMDGLEYKRTKFGSLVRKFIFWEEKMAVKHSHYLVADNMGIHDYYKEKYGKSSYYLAYGADVHDDYDEFLLSEFGLIPNEYYLIIARMEPENNIEMGVHYLYLLNKRYYTGVTNKDSRDLCVIASYNTGAGNVARALRGDTKISKAIPQINAMSYEELFRYFEKKLLPETQNYIRKVTERMNDFNKWMK